MDLKYKIGDRVKIAALDPMGAVQDKGLVGQVHTITGIIREATWPYQISYKGYVCKEYELELVNNETIWL
jgi:hypothetical protein